ncbi:hypothetical protein EB796_025203 [Bugula neritina]|uniref:Uncharacterized protein n=1 Tax=Bugula neritina TaxID=10212 RepID=A0A7J7IRG7_BUGNE|nr:hypothetical protein EB796_025203 [Bugula neritina]
MKVLLYTAYFDYDIRDSFPDIHNSRKDAGQKLDWCIQLRKLTNHIVPNKAQRLLVSATNEAETDQHKVLLYQWREQSLQELRLRIRLCIIEI